LRTANTQVLTRILVLILFLFSGLPYIYGQPTLSFDLKKPAKFENRKLGSEKTEEKKFTVVRRFTQNGVTKFNWHFNANNKLNEVLARAKAQHKDDYNRLLSFYNYSLDVTSKDKTELDSVIYKANAGILIHDLRNSWVDNLYMLMGKAYYFKKELDTAHLTFQYINYAFSPKEKDGYDIPIGSNAVEGGNAFSISTKESKNLAKKVWARPPSRNESFIWQIRTFLARDATAEAAGLIETLRNDPNFPDRLKSDLHEVQALWFYKQQVYDSAAIYLSQALDNAETREEKARWQYLIAQMYERAGNNEQAAEFYSRAVGTTLDPVLEVYGRLNTIRQNKGDDKVIQENIDKLIKMARKDRYLAYRDIIYYAAAEMELERNNVAGAKLLLLKATANASQDPSNTLRARAFLLLADLSFKERNYPDAKRFYDSITQVPPDLADAARLENLRGVLAQIVEQQMIINRQDSLQRIAAMPETEREAMIKKLVKQLRKQRGLKGDSTEESSGGPLFQDDKAPPDLFNNNAKGEWYFYNQSLKSKGFTEFKGKWGNRPNADNWRRMAAMRQQQGNVGVPGNPADAGKAGADAGSGAITYDELLKHVPLTDEAMQVSNDSIEKAQFILGKTYLEGLEDYPITITTLESFLDRFPASTQRPEALFMLAYCYHKVGDLAKEKAMQDELKQKFAGTSFEKIISDPNAISPDSVAKLDMTKRYDAIYNLFIEGNFEEALAQKKVADSLYGSNYWTPQLLYIQSVYFIKQRRDAEAIKSLQDITRLFSTSPMSEKAKTLIDVLGRRAQIEDYLTKLQIERPAEDSTVITDDIAVAPVPQRQQPVLPDTTAVAPTQPPVIKDSPVVKTPAPVTPDTVAKVTPPPVQPDTVARTVPPPVKQDTAVARTTIPPPDVATTTPPANRDTTAVVTAPDQKIQPPVTPPVVQQPRPPVVVNTDTARNKPVVNAPTGPAQPKTLSAEAASPHFVTIILDKVDPVYVNEARNAFTRYNRESFSGQGYTVNNVAITDDVKMVLIGTFPNADAAIAYVNKTRKLAVSEIIPWLPAAKYSFGIITNNNLEVLRNSKDVEAYRRFLQQTYPGQF
jgi:Uncharacterized protein conserved in bacteria